MLRVLGSPRKLCDRVTRRDFLQVGGLGAAGLGLSELLRQPAIQAATPRAAGRSFGKAKSCILLYLYGSPSQLETFDVKPHAPLAIRGELGTIPRAIPGFAIGELLPETAKILDRTTVVRSMSHPYPVHGIAYATSGLPNPEANNVEISPRDPGHWPFIGSVIDYVDESSGTAAPVPRNIALPFPLSTRRSGQPFRAGPYGGFLGTAYDPIWTEFQGEGTKRFVQHNRGIVQEFRDPYAGIKPNCSFRFATSGSTEVPAAEGAALTLDRLDRRRSLLAQLDDARRGLDASQRVRSLDRFQGLAWSVLTSSRLRQALDVAAEPIKARESYGITLFGQGALAARRLVEAGGRLVSLFWDEYGLADSAWDTHYAHYPRLKDELCPTFDRAYPALIRDLESRGLLDETLVVCISEHGRTPKLSTGSGGGRDHWSRAYSAIFAGGGFAAGRVVGKTDRFAGDVVEHPVSPKDILATVYHLLGIDPDSHIHDRLGRPFRIAGDGKVDRELLA